MRLVAFALALALLVFSPGAAFSQVIAITSEGVGIRNAKVQLATEIGGRGSDHAFVTIINRSDGDVKYEIHTHHELDFIQFHDWRLGDDGHYRHTIPQRPNAVTMESGRCHHVRSAGTDPTASDQGAAPFPGNEKKLSRADKQPWPVL